MKFILILFLTIWLTACSSAKKPEIIPDRFKDFMEQYFYGYKYEYKDVSARGNYNYGQQYALIKINKS
jgi:protein involved in ribonucleotide reduction